MELSRLEVLAELKYCINDVFVTLLSRHVLLYVSKVLRPAMRGFQEMDFHSIQFLVVLHHLAHHFLAEAQSTHRRQSPSPHFFMHRQQICALIENDMQQPSLAS